MSIKRFFLTLYSFFIIDSSKRRKFRKKYLDKSRYYTERISQKIDSIFIVLSAIIGHKIPKILDRTEGFKKILDEKLSLIRFGDGECFIMSNDNFDSHFQKNNSELKKKLQIACSDSSVKNLIRGIRSEKEFIFSMYPYFKNNSNDCIEASHSPISDEEFEIWKDIFRNEEIFLICGKGGRFSYIKELFDPAKSFEIFYTKPNDAFSEFENLLKVSIEKDKNKNKLILVSLGMTATVLCYELAKLGHRAIDFGDFTYNYLHRFKKKTLTEEMSFKLKLGFLRLIGREWN